MQKLPRSSMLFGALAVLSAQLGCARAPASLRCPPVVAAPPPALASPPPAAEVVAPRHKKRLAVLPIEDDRLFRSERAAVRGQLATALAQRAKGYRVLALATVDDKLQPVTKTGERCAFVGSSPMRRANDQGWHATRLLQVYGVSPKPPELWVKLGGWGQPDLIFASVWDSKLTRLQSYQSAIAQLLPLDGERGVLGGLSGRASFKHAARAASVSLCEREDKLLGDCAPHSTAWRDRLTAVAACYAGQDHALDELLIETAASPNAASSSATSTPKLRCETINLDETSGPDAQRERCLCTALLSSAGALVSSVGSATRSARRELRIEHQALDLADKPRPQIRVVEVSSTLHAERDWHQLAIPAKAKRPARSVSLRRLVVDNLDALAHPLARCPVASGQVVNAELTIGGNGAVTASRLLGGAKIDKATAACVSRGLARAAFACTSNSKPATMKIAFWWP